MLKVGNGTRWQHQQTTQTTQRQLTQPPMPPTRKLGCTAAAVPARSRRCMSSCASCAAASAAAAAAASGLRAASSSWNSWRQLSRPQSRQTTSCVVPCSSSTDGEPALWCRRSTFCVMSARAQPAAERGSYIRTGLVRCLPLQDGSMAAAAGNHLSFAAGRHGGQVFTSLPGSAPACCSRAMPSWAALGRTDENLCQPAKLRAQ